MVTLGQIWVITSVVSLLGSATLAEESAPKRLMCYYQSFDRYRSSTSAGYLPIAQIPGDLCTHVLYGHIDVSSVTGQLIVPGEDTGSYTQVVNLKQEYPSMRVLITLASPIEDNLAQVLPSPAKRTAMVNGIVNFIDQYSFDGIDIEFRTATANHKTDLVSLVSELRIALPSEKMIGLAVTPYVDKLQQGYNLPGLAEHVDWLTLVAYDMFPGLSKGVTGHSAALYWEEQGDFSVDAAVQYVFSEGVLPHKLVLGVPLFGRSWKLSNTAQNGVGAPINGQGNPGPILQAQGFLEYTEMCLNKQQGGWTETNVAASGTSYMFKGDQWVSGSAATECIPKGLYAATYRLGGVAVWKVIQGNPQGVCGEVEFQPLNNLHHYINLCERQARKALKSWLTE